MKTEYQPKTGQACHCKRGQQRDNCPDCEGTGMRIDFAKIRARADVAGGTIPFFAAIVASGIEYANHESDLYVPDSPQVREILKHYPTNERNASAFINQAPPHVGERWLDIPFAFLPWWEARQTKQYKATA